MINFVFTKTTKSTGRGGYKRLAFLIGIIILFLWGCSNPEVNQKKDSQSEDIAIDLSDVDTNLVPSLNEVIKETDKKKELFPDAYKNSWLISEMQKNFEFVGAGNQSITEMAKNYKNAVTTGILLKLA
ncbi:MAG TPA: hypothetical protein PK771_16140, partial [Spirochaetota bacterium]|nr:hypothetical protein [Spirochaetota bacterium]